MSDYYILITDAGAALEVSAHASGTTVELSEFGVCDGDVDFIPDPTQTAFANEVYRGAISSLTPSTDDSSVLVAQCIIPASSGGYTIRGIAIYASDGTLYATGNYADQDKPAPDSGFAVSLEILAQLAVSDTADVTLTVTDASYLTESEADTLYLRQDKNLSEIKENGAEAQTESRENIGCGTVATLDATTSTTDNTVGRVLKVGDRGLAATALAPAEKLDFNTYQFAADEVLGVDMSSALNIPEQLASLVTSLVYLHVTGVRDANNGCSFTLNEYFNKETWFCIRETDDSGEVGWVITKLPTNADDLNAIPSIVRGTIGDNGSFATASAPGFWLVNVQAPDTVAGFPKDQNGNYLYTYGFVFVYSDNGNPWVQIYYANQGALAWRQAWTTGPDETTPWVSAYSSSNPQDLSAYLTRADALATFVEGFQFGAVTQVAVSGNQYAASSGCVLSAIQDDDTGIYPAFDTVDAVYQKPAQIEINSSWLTVAG